MEGEAFADDLGDAHARGERAVGVLEYDLHFGAQRAHGVTVQCGDVAALKFDAAGRAGEAQQCKAECCFAGAGFTDHAECVALTDDDIYLIDGLDEGGWFAEEVFAFGEVDLNVFAFH